MEPKQFAKKIITTASSSWHFAQLSHKDENIEYAMKNVFHALRILDFGIQIKETGRIFDYGSMNDTKILIKHQCDKFSPRLWYDEFMKLQERLKC